MGEERGKGEKKKGGGGGGERVGIEKTAIIVFLVIILVNMYLLIFLYSHRFMQDGLAVSHPCLLPELSSTDLSICVQV